MHRKKRALVSALVVITFMIASVVSLVMMQEAEQKDSNSKLISTHPQDSDQKSSSAQKQRDARLENQIGEPIRNPLTKNKTLMTSGEAAQIETDNATVAGRPALKETNADGAK